MNTARQEVAVPPSGAHDRVSLTIAVLTYRRPSEIAALLPVLVDVSREVESLGYAAGVLVVDNDAAGSARLTAAAFAADGVRYVVESEPGISAARNRALRESVGSDLLAFIDDDERPEPGWLPALLTTLVNSGATGVAGPVRSNFPDSMHPWVAAGEFMNRRHRAATQTGEVVAVAATNNLLLDLREIERLDLSFDPAFGLTGGEDTLFTRTLAARGGRIVWCREAVVLDEVADDRVSTAWLLRRAFSHGNTETRVATALAGSRARRATARARAGAAGVPRVLYGSLRWLWGLLSRSTKDQARGLTTAARGAGMTATAFGATYRVYRRESGPSTGSGS